MASAGNFANAATDLGGAVTDLFGARGARSSAGSYEEAQRIAEENAVLAGTATRTKALLLQRQITKSLGTTQAQVGGAGFAASGSALDIMRDSASQGAITKALNEEQGAITVNSFREQANQFGAMAKAAKSSSLLQEIGGIFNLGGAGLNAFGGISSLGGAGAASGGAGAALPAGAADLVDLAVLA